MRLFGLYITTAKRQKKRADASRDRRLRQDDYITKLSVEKFQLIKSCEILIAANKSRQQGRALARRQEKLAAKSLMQSNAITR